MGFLTVIICFLTIIVYSSRVLNYIITILYCYVNKNFNSFDFLRASGVKNDFL